MKEDLKQEILKQQGDLLYVTLSEECAELIQACSKIKRKKFYEEDISKEEYNNLLEEIGDVEINIELIKHQIIKDYLKGEPKNENIKLEEINLRIKDSKRKKEKELLEKFAPIKIKTMRYKIKLHGEWVPAVYNYDKQCFEEVEDE